jgi:RNA-directed DNA polymerase
MNTEHPMYEWKDIPWRKLEKIVFKLQRRIYQASQRGNVRIVHKLQRLLMKSWGARCLAVRRVTQDNQGKKTAGVDGIKSLTPAARLHLVKTLNLKSKPRPTRRVWIPKPGKAEKRPLGIPTLRDRATQALVKLALEPEWEARFESNSYGFRPERSCHDAIAAIFISINKKAKYVLDADIKKCFDRINHEALLRKVHTIPSLNRVLKAWLKAGVMDRDILFPTEEGTPQGGIISPLLANIALHGLETKIRQSYPIHKKRNGMLEKWKPNVIRYADDFVILHRDAKVIQECKEIAERWLQEMGLSLSPEKTRITHTFNSIEGQKSGFNFLGFNVRQYPVPENQSGTSNRGKRLGLKTIIKPSQESIKSHYQKLRRIVSSHKSASQKALIANLNSVIKGWSRYYSTVASKSTLHDLDSLLFRKLLAWAKRRHPKLNHTTVANKYWRLREGQGWKFGTKDGYKLYQHSKTPIKRHIKVKDNRSPFDGDFIYWATRKGTHPLLTTRTAYLLKHQKGRCEHCELFFKMEDRMETHHKNGNHQDNSRDNLCLVHNYCHDQVHGKKGTSDNGQLIEEPCEAKASSTVLKTSRFGDEVA